MAKVFISYARDDEPHKRLLHNHLSTLGLDLETVSDTDITPGSQWKDELEAFMDSADAGVLLLSTSFLKSEWCQAELVRLTNRKSSVLILPVLVRSCEWKAVPELAKTQLVNPDKPAQDAQSIEGIWLEIARSISEAIQRKVRLSTSRSTLEDAWENEWSKIRKAVERGLFTPILGPGCYELSENTQGARDHVGKRLKWIVASLDNDRESQEYVKGVVAGNLIEALDYKVSEENPSEPWMKSLIELQAGLARLGTDCCRLLGNEMREHPRGFTDLRSLSADIALAIPANGARPLRGRFFDATDLAARLYDDQKMRHDLKSRGLGTRGILEQLVMLTYAVFFPEICREKCDEEVRDWKERYKGFIEVADKLIRPRVTPELPRLSLLQVEWIGELLWHTIRFEAPMYPSPEDLAFQLSVCLDTSIPPRRERMSTVAELTGRKHRVELIRKWFQGYAKRAPEEREKKPGLYDALARALWFVDPAKEEYSPKRRLGTAGESTAQHMKRIPVAITTNFDLELEGALDKHKRPYHVLFPVYLFTENDGSDHDSEPPEDWLLRTMIWDDDGEAGSTDVLLGKNSLREIEDQFSGPLIVKLNGSPLHKLRSKKPLQGMPLKIGPETSVTHEHRISLSDFDFIKAMISRDRFWPPGLRELLDANNRVLCFLGHPLADASSRLRLSDHLGGDPKKRTLYLIDFPEDPLRHTLLKRLKVGLITSTIDQLVMHFIEWFPEV